MLRLYKQLFQELHHYDVMYCVWKNKNELQEALEGKGDIDLYVANEARNEFVKILIKHGFIRAISPNNYPYIDHYYGFDEATGRLCHLHCYFRIVTGESHIKQFVLPIGDYVRQLPSEKNEFDVMEMNRALQQKLNCFRRKIKVSCLPGLYLFIKERAGYKEEKQILQGSDDERTLAVLSTGWLADIQVSDSAISEVLSGLAYRRQFRHFSRYSFLETVYHRYTSIASRALGKITQRNKSLPSGVIVVLSGPIANTDPLSQNIKKWLGGEFTIRQLALPVSTETSTDRGAYARTCAKALQAAARGYMVLLEDSVGDASNCHYSAYLDTADLVFVADNVAVEAVGNSGDELKIALWRMLQKTQL